MFATAIGGKARFETGFLELESGCSADAISCPIFQDAEKGL